ncbi:kinase-like domain-containing protein, partial [Mycena metata]
MSSPSPLSLSLDARQTAEPAPTESTGPQAPPTKILIYQTLISFLKAACSARVSGRSHNQIVRLQRVLDGYLISMSSESVVDAVAKSLECRKTLLEFASEHGLTTDPDLRHSLRADEGNLVTHITSIFDSKAAEHDVLNLEGDSAQCFLDVIQDALDRGFLMAQQHAQKAHRLIRKLSEVCDKLPSSLFITGVSGRGEHPTFGGGFGSVYRASYDNKPVALKVMRHFVQGSELREIRVKLCREALIWKELHHPYILTFIGIDQDSFPSTLGMVSPWMEHGTILNYLNIHGRLTVDKLLFEIAQGLQYLHSRNIVHGDLRGANILISEAWTACLAGFGLSALADTTSTLHSTKRSGSLYWMAPELIDPGRFGSEFLRTLASDVYAFGCVCMELYTGRPPFSEVSDIAALFKILNGERAQRPTGTPAMSDTLWQCVTEFWVSDPPTRPSSKVVVQKMLWPTLEPDTEEDGSLHEEDSPKSPKNSEFGPRAYATPTSRDDPNNVASTKGEDIDIVGEPGQSYQSTASEDETTDEASTEDEWVDTGFRTGWGNGSLHNEQSLAPADNSECELQAH